VVAANNPSAKVELHMLVCRRDKRLAVSAIKSFYRFTESDIGVVLTDDGSLSDSDREWISSHIHNAEWLPRYVCDDRIDEMYEFPRLLSLYKSGYHPLCKFLHPLLCAKSPRVIVLDPDTAFFKRPNELLAWIANEKAPALFLHDNQDESRQVPPETCSAFESLRQAVASDGAPWNMPYYFFNSGLLAYRRSDMAISKGEQYLNWLVSSPREFKTGKSALWFGDWTPEQTIYQVLFAMLKQPARPLGTEYRIGAAPGCIFNHFLWLYLAQPETLRRLSKLVEDLASSRVRI